MSRRMPGLVDASVQKGRAKFNKPKKLPMATKKLDDVQNRKIVNLERKFKEQANQYELCHIDTNLSGQTLNSTGNFILLNGVIQGNTVVTREGDQTRMTSVLLKGFIHNNVLELAFSTYRILIVYDKQSNGAAPVLADILDGGVTFLTGRFYNTDYVPNRFRIVYDEIFNLNNSVVEDFDPATGATQAYAPQTRKIDLKIPLNKKVWYGLGNAGTIADLATGSLYLVLCGTEASGATPGTMNGGARVYFKDM